MINVTPIHIEKTDIWLIPLVALSLSVWFWFSGSSGIWSLVDVMQIWLGDFAWQNITVLGNTLLLLSILAFFIRFHAEWVLASIIGLLLASIILYLLKYGIFIDDFNVILNRLKTFLIGGGSSDNGFVSVYSASAFVVATIIFFGVSSKIISMAVLLLAMLVLFSRLMLASHTPFDVFAGAAIGWLCAYIGIYLTNKCQRINKAVFVMMALLILSVSILLFFHETGYQLAFEFQMMIAALGAVFSSHALFWVFSKRAN